MLNDIIYRFFLYATSYTKMKLHSPKAETECQLL